MLLQNTKHSARYKFVQQGHLQVKQSLSNKNCRHISLRIEKYVNVFSFL